MFPPSSSAQAPVEPNETNNVNEIPCPHCGNPLNLAKAISGGGIHEKSTKTPMHKNAAKMPMDELKNVIQNGSK